MTTNARQSYHRDHLLQAVRLGPARRLDGAELLTTFAEEAGSATLTPDATGGVFEVRVEGDLIWSRKKRSRFPDVKELKRLVRDRIAPGRSLGHTDEQA